MANPDLEKRGEGNSDPEITGGGLKTTFIWPVGPLFGLKIRGGHPGPSPGPATDSHIGICAAPKGMVFAPYRSESGCPLCPVNLE